MGIEPDGLHNRRTAKPAPTPAVAPAPESSFNFEKQKLEKLRQELEGQSFPQRLGLLPGATPEEARKVLKQKTKEFHPDNKPDELKESYGKIFTLYTEASNAYTEGSIRKPKFKKKPTPLEKFGQAFRVYRTFDAPVGKSPLETFNVLKEMYLKKGAITEEEANQLQASLVDKAA
jgi:hypothetical protein